ncbi:hypothetical protein EG346_19400 [Chryseobacterium carnipullorum]|uniref:Uncharacterized protein n=1 Tax=Chryseobacterium carnipullorum TaxID=1124835 RepID=A0A3G6NJB3_CHRCU|nr:hypothetical protein EG346_19400 [Chryseobacterium carnipullorum]AZA65079.1 hypothetical protein EG345_10440 [Chryseobacterium carnipullorum]
MINSDLIYKKSVLANIERILKPALTKKRVDKIYDGKNYFLMTFAVSIFVDGEVFALCIVSAGIGAASESAGIVSIMTLSDFVIVSTLVSFLQLNTVKPKSMSKMVNFITAIFCNVLPNIIQLQNDN